MLNFVHAIVFDKTEYEGIKEMDGMSETWDLIKDGDYIVHCLYDTVNHKCIYLDDNTHHHIEEEIESFVAGCQYAGSDVIVTRAYTVATWSYDVDEVAKLIEEHNYTTIEAVIREGCNYGREDN